MLLPLYIDDHVYDWIVYDESLDLTAKLSCSPFVTSATTFIVFFTYELLTENGTNPIEHNLITKQKNIDLMEILNVSFPFDEGIQVSLQMMQDEPGK